MMIIDQVIAPYVMMMEDSFFYLGIACVWLGGFIFGYISGKGDK